MIDERTYWLWYPGDLELYHAMKQNFSRVERGCAWPAFWKSEGFRCRVAFRREYDLIEETVFSVLGVTGSQGYVQLDEEKHPFGELICCASGKHRISIHIACIGCVPAVYVSGEIIRSEPGWTVEDYDRDPVPAAYNRYFTDRNRDPADWPTAETIYLPTSEEEINGGVLFSFETELTASLELNGPDCPKVCLGESRPEALDTEKCYFSCFPDPVTRCCPRQAMRYAFIPGAKAGEYSARAIHQYVEIPVQASFRSDDPELDRIFSVASHTFMLCSGVFFLDGIKRDKWIWGGDAYQSQFVNRYLTADREIEKRTLIALRGNDPVTTHVNTILDYSLLWLLSVGTYFESYGDRAFVDLMLPKMESMMTLCMSQREEHGFIIGRKRDWLFVDWADFDRDGPLCAEQMLLAACYRLLGELLPGERGERYRDALQALLKQIEALYWDEERGAYIDSFTSGRRHVTRHANIFAVLFDIADEQRKHRIADSVLFNDAVPAITTPYFRFFELEALCRLGYLREAMDAIKAYWGGMLKLGAVTFWEQYDPEKPAEEQYEMYGDPYGKSLCHAWAASPIYLIARYFVGLRALEPGGRTYKVQPAPGFFRELDCRFPMGGKNLHITLKDGALSVEEN